METDIFDGVVCQSGLVDVVQFVAIGNRNSFMTCSNFARMVAASVVADVLVFADA